MTPPLPEQEKKISDVQKINDDIVFRITEKLWSDLCEETKEFSDARRLIVFSRITAYMVGNVYMPAVQLASDSMMNIQEEQNE
jgi:hypothetical protein